MNYEIIKIVKSSAQRNDQGNIKLELHYNSKIINRESGFTGTELKNILMTSIILTDEDANNLIIALKELI